MGQYFYLLNLDNTAYVESSPNGSKFGEFYFSAMAAGPHLLRALWKPEEDEKRVVVLSLNKAEGFTFPQESNENSSKVPLKQLSNEVLDLIFGKILDILDLINLMVTCQRYWEFGRRYLERLIEDAIVVSWAGDRLICMGDYAELEDLPCGMLTESEVERIRPLVNDESLLHAITVIQKQCRKLVSTTWKRMGVVSSTRDLFFELDTMIFLRMQAGGQYYNIPRFLKKLILIKDLDPNDFFHGSFVLRNLTTKEYVRGDGISKAWDMPKQPWLKRMRFEHVLYCRTTWSSDPSLTCYYNGPLQIHRGKWAGHRFDVARIGCVVNKDGVAVDNWKDVTKEVIDEVIDIWKDEVH